MRRLAVAAAEVVVERLPAPDCELVTFVPPDRTRSLERGFHPAERLARELAAAWSLPCEPLLRRSGRSRRQRGLALAERRRNVRGAFEPTGRIAGRRILLVDDVYTSGTTANAASSALRRGGAREVAVVTFARTIRGPRIPLQ